MALTVWNAVLGVMLGRMVATGTMAPRDVLLQIGGDPAVGFSVGWRAAMGSGSHQLETADEKGRVRVFSAESTVIRRPDFVAGDIHKARAEGLAPGSWLRWRVVSNGLASPWRSMRTASRTPEPFEFLVMGDAQAFIRRVSGSLFARAMRDVPNARFALHAGDMIDNNLSVGEWEEWIGACQPLSEHMPSAVTPGNHEYGIYGRAKYKDLSPLFHPYFAPPQNGLPGLKDTTWYFDFQGVRVASLDTMKPLKPQLEWLERLPRNPAPRWLILLHHYPVFVSMKGQEAPGRTRLLKETYERLGVDMVFTGHLHSYARSGLIKGPLWDSPEGGVVYMISNSGAKHYRQDWMPWMKVGIPRLTSYAAVKVAKDRLIVEARDVNGQVRDRFVIDHAKGRAKARLTGEAVQPSSGSPKEDARL